MEKWKKILSDSADEKTISKFLKRFRLKKSEIDEIKRISRTYPMRVNPYYLSLIKKKGDAVWAQCIPDIRELKDRFGFEDPLHEEIDSPVPGLTHRYPDRVLLLVKNQCSMYCRFCTRKRRVGDSLNEISKSQILRGIEYIRKHREVRDVVISGGDPLLLDDRQIEFILKKIRAIKHVEIIRIGTRVPCTLPQRITKKLCRMLSKYHPLYINTHFNHPDELTKESIMACGMMADAGIPLGNQTVLLKGINDKPETMKKLVQKLLVARVKPYYLYQADIVKGTNHFRTDVKTGIKLIHALRGFTSGMAVPHYVIDAPGGGGKTPVDLGYIVGEKYDRKGKYRKVVMRNYKKRIYEYPLPK
ncbi:MAG: KamA family radical SAM protein [Candidatus Woesearchaeota archaeon]|nr:KamA family radical SAM protein [Candidatus Woesearchaeota archaeon]